jgi:hypothetical protein
MPIVSSYPIYALHKTLLQAVYIHLPALVCSILNVVDSVITVVVLYSPSRSICAMCNRYFDGLLVVYTVSGVDLNLQTGCLCASACAQN